MVSKAKGADAKLRVDLVEEQEDAAGIDEHGDIQRLAAKPEEIVECLTLARLSARDLPIQGVETRLIFCSVTLTDAMMGRQAVTTKGIKSSGPAMWEDQLEFHRYHGNPREMLLTIEIFLRAWHSRRRHFIGSLTLDVQDDEGFEEDSAQWHRLSDASGALLQSTLRVQIGRKQRLARDIRAERNRRRLKRLAVFTFLAMILCAILLPVLWPRGCDAECRGEWKKEVSLQSNRSNFAAVVHQSRIYVLGGCCDLDTVETLGVGEGRWRSAEPLSSGRIRLGAASVRGELWAVGGMGDASVESYDGAAWSSRDPIPNLHPWVHAAQPSPDSLCVIGRDGGAGNVPPSLGGDSFYNQSVVCWSHETQRWSLASTLPTDRHSYAVTSYRGALVVVGGWHHGPSHAVEAFDGRSWTRLPALLEGRYALGVAQSGGYLFALGGSNGYRTLSSVESFDGEEWRLELPMSVPRQHHAAVAFAGRLFVLGGSQVGAVGQPAAETSAVESFAFRE